MKIWTVFVLLLSACATANNRSAPEPGPISAEPCTKAWYRAVESRVPTGDGRGHGPDPGSLEWQSTVEFKLGIRGRPAVPERGSNAWCRHIDRLLRADPAEDVN
ncbi:MAG TPA: hypothetical protein VJ910_05590 [Desulfuromonadales bacterium]|nr:hypothetical protein [Desulfuromonadales bacterium]